MCAKFHQNNVDPALKTFKQALMSNLSDQLMKLIWNEVGQKAKTNMRTRVQQVRVKLEELYKASSPQNLACICCGDLGHCAASCCASSATA